MRRSRLALAAAAVALAVAASPAAARTVSGVNVPEAADVAGKPVVLNGAGIRTRFFVEVYVGALYLEAKTGDANAVVAADAPKKVVVTMLRDLGKAKLMGAIKDGFEANSKGQVASLLPRLARVDAAMQDLKKGDVLEIAWVPGTGSVMKGPAGAVTIEGKDFSDALLRVWLGNEPADKDLKAAMLGR